MRSAENATTPPTASKEEALFGASKAAKANAKKADAEVSRQKALKALRSACVFCFLFMLCELAGGYKAHSLAILTDAAHLLTDVAGFGLAIFSLQVAVRASSKKFSFGWHRAEVVGTFASMFTIWGLVSIIFYEAIFRIYDMWLCADADVAPSEVTFTGFFSEVALQSADSFRLPSGTSCDPVQAPLMVLIGCLGLAVNLTCAGILTLGGHHGHSHGPSGSHGHSHDLGQNDDDHGHSHEGEDHGHERSEGLEDHHHGSESNNPPTPPVTQKRKRGAALNSAFIHALSDCVQSCGVIAAAIFIWVCNYSRYGKAAHATSVFNLADPLSSIFFGVITLYFTRPLMQELLGILMESAPAYIDADALGAKLWEIAGVVGVHDLHIWSLSAEKPSLSVHLVATDHVATLEKAQLICEAFGISHHTIQVDDVRFGSDRCVSDIGCAATPTSPLTIP